jgi:hypothetical protein
MVEGFTNASCLWQGSGAGTIAPVFCGGWCAVHTCRACPCWVRLLLLPSSHPRVFVSLLLFGGACSVHVVLPWTRPQRHIVDAEFVLTEALKVCPNGALFLWMAGRLERLKRNLDESVAVRH